MTITEPASANIARDSANVAVQAEAVHGDVTVYQVSPGASPAERFRAGVRYLGGGMPTKAKELIVDAVMDGHRSGEAGFHWFLAHLSGRTRREFSDADIARLRDSASWFFVQEPDEWTDGLRLLGRVLDSLDAPDGELELVVKEFDGLGRLQRNRILRHLSLFLAGPLQDMLWVRAAEQARSGRMARKRADRVWKFFQPNPRGPHLKSVRPPAIAAKDWLRAYFGTAGLAAAIGYLGYLLLLQPRISAIGAYVAAVLAACVCANSGGEWCFRNEMLRLKDMRYLPPAVPRPRGPAGGFTNGVDKMFGHYFAKYVPRGATREEWLADTAGFGRALREEVTELYREARTGPKPIAWLVRYLITDVQRRWTARTLFDYRRRYSTPPTVKATFLLAVTTLAAAGLWAVFGALTAAPLGGASAMVLAVGGAWAAAAGWLTITVERRRSATESEEAQGEFADRRAAFDRWRAKLADTPTDAEMAAWLDCDRRLLIDDALRHYRLAPSDVIAHAMLEAPAGHYQRARVRNGPWRYSRYRLLLFLLTTDGVRQVSTELDFAAGAFVGRRRTNYRFDAVSSVQVAETGDERTFELTLVDGNSLGVHVTEASAGTDGDSPEASAATRDATGVDNTLHVLEGIAAEGKRWIVHESRRRDNRLTVLRDSVRSLPG
ncbi:hypothetical protein AB0I28_00610 [Phytomonospora sp. NPDC050363]|uniref:hypothetical protein n=1 Tax=Phytomonospora sp. NPDC050363 TaxID=3155642 RepID=UPI0033E9102A